MANTKISNLTGAASVTDASVFPVVDSGSTKKVTGTQIKTYARTGLSTVATSGSYADLTNKPTLFDGNYNSLSNKPTIFSGAYADLTGKPTLFDGNYNSLTNKPTIPDVSGLASTDYVDTAIAGVSGGGASTGNITFSDTTLTSTNGDVKIHFEPSASPAVEFNFSQSGNLTIPSNLVCNGHMNIVTTQYNDIDLYTNDWNGGGVEVWLQHNDKVSISTDNGNYTWNFTNNGEFQFPNNVKQVNTGTVICDANMDTVIYTGTTQYQHTFKLLLKVEGMENDGQTGWDTQSCEMMIAKSFRNDAVAGSVYGLVYTSTNPLATFTTRWNASTSRIEVLCRPTSTLYGVEVRSFVTEMPTSD